MCISSWKQPDSSPTHTLCRHSEIIAIQVEDLNFVVDGSSSVYITRSKTDPTGSVKYLSHLTVQHLQHRLDWVQIAP
ncbi:hypothetical protein [Methylobacter sp.]|uniref:hypothetical protein n=1 Tax=Methylobacter sp. TaxID=2051955 RepID=UPI003DA5E2AD